MEQGGGRWGWARSRQKQGGKEGEKKKKQCFGRLLLSLSPFVPISLPSSPWVDAYSAAGCQVLAGRTDAVMNIAGS